MKQIVRRIIYLVIVLILASNLIAQDTVQVIITGLKQNSIPIKYIEPGNDFSDLQPLKPLLANIQVVGLGECSHGTMEFFLFKYRMLKFLVKEMGFTVYALESSYAACQEINEYILYGKGDLATCLASQGYLAWDTQEFTEMLRWMRAYNESVPENKKVKFVGLDVHFNGVGRKKFLAYLTQTAPDRATAADSLFQVLDREDEYWPFKLNKKDSIYFKAIDFLQQLMDFIQENRAKLVLKSSPEMFERNQQLLRVMQEDVEANSKDDKGLRDKYMAENLEFAMKKLYPKEKTVLWAHNCHVTRDTVYAGYMSLGNYVAKKFGTQYYAVGFEFNEGSYQGRRFEAPDKVGEVVVFQVLPSPRNNLGWWLKQTQRDKFFLDLRKASRDPDLHPWLNSTLTMHGRLGWVNDPADVIRESTQVCLQPSFDALFFVDKTSPSHPTGTTVKMNRL